MQLGWIDFSKEDKSNALNVIHTLESPGVLDELGFGVLRNIFANDFFPGTSTLHTRAKYLYLIPYLLYEFQKKCLEGKGPSSTNVHSFVKDARDLIDDGERVVKNLLMKNGGDETKGVIGSSIKKDSYWVDRTPIIIYWTGLKTYGFLDCSSSAESMSYSELLAHFCNIVRNKEGKDNVSTSKESKVSNDSDVGDSNYIPIKKGLYKSCWRDEVSIDLSPEEANDLKSRIIESELSKNSLFALMLKENLLPDAKIEMDFESFVETIKNNRKVPDDIKKKLDLACRLNDFYHIVLLRYYMLLNEDIFIDRWNVAKKTIKKACLNFDPDILFSVMNVKKKPKLLAFLKDVKRELLKATSKNDFSKVDDLITERERKLKTIRSKIGHPERYTYEELEKIKVPKFNYRFFTAKQYVSDIQEGLNNHVKS